MKELSIPGVPYVRVYYGEPRPNPYGGRAMRDHTDVHPSSAAVAAAGPTRRDIAKAATGCFPASLVTRIEALPALPAAASAASAGAPLAAVLVTERSRTSPLLRAMAHQLRGLAAFYEVPAALAAAAERLGVDAAAAPALTVLPHVAWVALLGNGGAAPLSEEDAAALARFEGDLRSLREVVAFVRRRAPAGFDIGGAGASGDAAGEATDDSGNKRGDVAGGGMSGAELEVALAAGPEAWVVAFVAVAAAVDTEIPGWAAKAAQMGGAVRAAVIACGTGSNGGDESSSTAAGAAAACAGLGVAAGSVPTVRVWPHGDGGAEREAQAFGAGQLDAAMEAVAASLPQLVLVVPGDGANSPAQAQQLVQPLLQGILAAHGGPRPLVFLLVGSRRPEPALLFRSLAAAHAEWLRVLYFTQPTRPLMESLQIPRLPSASIMYPVTGAELASMRAAGGADGAMSDEAGDPAPDESVMMLQPWPVQQMGPMNFASLNFWVKGHAAVVMRSHGVTEDGFDGSDGSGDGGGNGGSAAGGFGGGDHGAAAAAAVVPTALPEATASNWPAAFCPATGSKLCVVAVTVHDDKVAQAAVLGAAASLAGRAALFGFSWVDGECQPDFAAGFDVSGYPGLVVYSPKRRRYARFVGTFAAANVEEFLVGVLAGRVPTVPALQEPALAALDCQSLAEKRAALAESIAGGLSGSSDNVAAAAEEDMEDLLAEIWAEEEQERLRREAEIETEALRRAEEEAAAVGKKTGKRKKKKKKTKKSASDEL
ncbi:unnamed protein product [Phaeothamnion confervicola]